MFKASYFDGKRSCGLPVYINLQGATIYIQSEDGLPLLSVPLRECEISPPLGKTSRTIRFPNGAQCETVDLAAVETLWKNHGGKSLMNFVNCLESRWKMVGICLIGLVIFVLILSKYAIPLASKKIAFSLPHHLTDELSRSTLEILDYKYLKTSVLDDKVKNELKDIFFVLHEEIDPGSYYRLEFRKSPLIGPNAFALPSGLILITDELVEISQDNKELIGIMAHEVAHVKYRHGLRSVFQNSGIFLLISSLFGDVTSITSIGATLPTLLARSGYSREFEREADQTAGLYLIQKGWSTKPYQHILMRITKNVHSYPEESVFSSHPIAQERVFDLQKLEDNKIIKDTLIKN
ncbi:MAG: M48 family metallopeptidase [Nitrospirae bacterium]|nr:M48 family metallopeptidase [Nitrospirota bacterium]